MKLFRYKEKTIISKHKKYTTRNPISRYLTGNFFNKIGKLLLNISFESVLEDGCGEGILLHNIQEYLVEKNVFAVDINPAEIEAAKKNIPFATCTVASAYDLPFSDNEFDLVICCEVLEHLDNPDLALQEIRRKTAKYCILSVPNEPYWCFRNMVRGAYIAHYGNTPGHINHWSNNSFQRYIAHNFQILKAVCLLPCVAVLCGQKDK